MFSEIVSNLKEIGAETIKILQSSINEPTISVDYESVRARISDLFKLYRSMQNGNSVESLSDLVENELATMDKAIEEAAIRIEVINLNISVFFILSNSIIF